MELLLLISNDSGEVPASVEVFAPLFLTNIKQMRWFTQIGGQINKFYNSVLLVNGK